jgi:DNA primase
MESLNENWELFCSKLEKVKQTSNGIEALCPAHDDISPSLTASFTKDKILFKCQAGCSFESVVSALGMEENQFFAQEEKNQPKTIESTYRYEDKDGNHVMDVVRFKPKAFLPRRPDGKYSLEGVIRVPYRLPQMLEAIEEGRTVLLVEGEKDCDNLAKLGLTATTFQGGAGKWRDDYLQWFKGASIACLPDNDNAGREGMNLLASKISQVASSIRWLNIPGIPEKGDISDWIKIEGNELDKFKTMVRDSAVQWTSDLANEWEYTIEENDEWAEFVTLVREEEEPRPFPVEALGSTIEKAVIEFQGYGKQPLSMIASSALATASLACQGLADVGRDSQNIGPISLSLLIIAESGERKSSLDKAFSKSLRDWEREKAVEMKADIKKSIADHSDWEAKRQGLLGAIKENQKKNALRDLPKEQTIEMKGNDE